MKIKKKDKKMINRIRRKTDVIEIVERVAYYRELAQLNHVQFLLSVFWGIIRMLIVVLK